MTGYEMVLPMNSGAEAIETAIKTARKWGLSEKGLPQDKAEIIACANNFHGRTMTIISFSTEPLYRNDFGPFTPGSRSFPSAMSRLCEQAITPNTAAFLVEPIQAEAGILIPPDGYLKGPRRSARRTMSCSSPTRSRPAWAGPANCSPANMRASRPTWSSSASRWAAAAIRSRPSWPTRDILGVFKPGEHGSTFGGNPLACAVAREALKVIQEEKLVENAAEIGEYFLDSSRRSKAGTSKRSGAGASSSASSSSPKPGRRRFCEELMKEGLLCKETHENVIRFAPPLIIKKKDLNWAFKRIKRVFKRAQKS